MLFYKTIAFYYLRYTLIILVALTGFMVGFDMMNNSDELPKSANLLILYSIYKWLYALDMMLPITLIFAFIATIIELVRTNALTSFYALGYSKWKVLSPVMMVSSTIVMIYIAAHTTSFARANEYADNLRESAQFITPTNDLFFTHEGNYIYFGTLNPLTQHAKTIRVFTFRNGTLQEALSADEAYYQNHYWNIPKAHLLQPPETLFLKSPGFRAKDVEHIRVLKDFRPKILDQIYEGKVNYTILDALDALALLGSQNIDLSKVKSSLYRNFVTPWFALIMIVFIYAFVPVSPRFANLSLYSFGSILVTLIVWGLLFMSGELANNKTLSPEAGILFPIGALGVACTLYLSSFWVKSRLNIIHKG